MRSVLENILTAWTKVSSPSHPPSSGISIPAVFSCCAHPHLRPHQASGWPLLPPHRPGTAEMGASLAQLETDSSRNGELAIVTRDVMKHAGRIKTPRNTKTSVPQKRLPQGVIGQRADGHYFSDSPGGEMRVQSVHPVPTRELANSALLPRRRWSEGRTPRPPCKSGIAPHSQPQGHRTPQTLVRGGGGNSTYACRRHIQSKKGQFPKVR